MTDLGPTSTVVVIRHAHAGDTAISDHERTLDKRGRREAMQAGQWLAASGLVLDVVLCSSSQRTRQTWAVIADQLDDPPAVSIEERIYNCDLDDLLDLLDEDRAQVSTIAVVGHNPAVTELAEALSNDPEIALAPGAVAVIEVSNGRGAPTGRLTASWQPDRH